MSSDAEIVGIKEELNILESMKIGDSLTFEVGSLEYREAKKLLPGYRYKKATFAAKKVGNHLLIVRLNDKVVNDDYSMKLFQCSGKAAKYLEANYLTGKIDLEQPLAAKFPLHLMLVGQSFALPLIDAKYKRFVIEKEIANYNHISGKKFRVIEHSKIGLYEVVRVA